MTLIKNEFQPYYDFEVRAHITISSLDLYRLESRDNQNRFIREQVEDMRRRLNKYIDQLLTEPVEFKECEAKGQPAA